MPIEREVHVVAEPAGEPAQARGPIDRAKEEAATLGELFRQLGEDANTLVREEVRLAKLEIRQEARAISADFVKVAIALGLALLGALALTAFLILVVGLLLDEAFWAGALIVGVLFLLIGGVLARNAINDLKTRSLKPDDTVETLHEDKRWAKHEAQEFKREIKS